MKKLVILFINICLFFSTMPFLSQTIFAENDNSVMIHETEIQIEDCNIYYTIQEDGSILEVMSLVDEDGSLVEMIRTISQQGEIIGTIKKNGNLVSEINTQGEYSDFLAEALKSNLPTIVCEDGNKTYSHYFLSSKSQVIDRNRLYSIAIDGTSGVISVVGVFASLPGLEVAGVAIWIVGIVKSYFMDASYAKLVINSYDAYRNSDNNYMGVCFYIWMYECSNLGDYVSGGENHTAYKHTW